MNDRQEETRMEIVTSFEWAFPEINTKKSHNYNTKQYKFEIFPKECPIGLRSITANIQFFYRKIKNSNRHFSSQFILCTILYYQFEETCNIQNN